MIETRRSASKAGDVVPAFTGSRLTLARHLAGYRKSDLARLLGKSATAVAAWESGTKRPTASTIAELALCLSVDPWFFAARGSDAAAASSAAHFRSLRSTTQLGRDQAEAYGRIAVDIADVLHRHVEFPEPDVPSYPVDVNDRDLAEAGAAARLVRDTWGLGHGPMRHLVRLLENHGVLVVFSPTQSSSVDAYSFVVGERPVIILNPVKRDYYRQRFDAAHELGHLVMHGDAEPGSRTVEEHAHAFAAELLMPAREIETLLPVVMNTRSWHTLAQLKEQWGVSMQALLYRARQLGRLGDVSYRNAMTTINTRGWRRHEPGLITTIEQPSLLPRTLELLDKEGIDIEKIITDCAMPRHLFEIATSRAPLATSTESDGNPAAESRTSVVSLLDLHGDHEPDRPRTE